MNASPPPPDFSRLARRRSERAAIVEYIRRTPDLQESDFLEWKTAYDLSTKPGRTAVSKHLIAFANREMAQAERNAEGYAYLLLGLEPGNLVGVPVWDSADIENWLSPYTGTDLRYGPPDYIPVDGVHVLFLVVDPPRDGDPIYCMQKAGADADANNGTIPEGAIFVRHGGKSERHTSADLRRLTARAVPNLATPLQLGVELDGSKIEVINKGLLHAASRDEYVEHERRRLLGSLPRPPRSPLDFAIPTYDSRSQEEFIEEVHEYLSHVEARWFNLVAAKHVEEEESRIVASLVNDTASNFEDVVLELTFPFPADHVFASQGDADARLAAPLAPRVWGSLASFVPNVAPVRGLHAAPRPEVEAVDSGSALVRYPGIHARPRSRHRLDRLLVTLPPEFSGVTVDVTWRATSRSTDGDLSGSAALAIPPDDATTCADNENIK